MKTEIGKAEIIYSVDGEILSTSFVPSLVTTSKKVIEKQLQNIGGGYDEKVMQKNAEMVMAHWFKAVDEIETSDRFSGKGITSEINMCNYYPNGRVKFSVIKFFYEDALVTV